MYENWKKIENYLLLAKKVRNDHQKSNKNESCLSLEIRIQFEKELLRDRNRMIETLNQYRQCKLI